MANFNGGTGADYFEGQSEADQANGNGGNDELLGFGGNDQLDGGEGDDIVWGGLDQDIVAGGAGSDNVSGSDGWDYLYSDVISPAYSRPYSGTSAIWPVFDTGTAVDTLSGGNGNDVLSAGYGDHVDGGGDIDGLLISFIAAGAGVNFDFRILAAGGSLVIGGATLTGLEYLIWTEGSNFDDFIADGGFSGNFAPIFGRGGNDHIIAGYYTGQLYGGDGDDILDNSAAGYGFDQYGEAGNDHLIGGNSYERLDGGEGNDQIEGHYGYDYIYGGTGNDVIDGGSFDDNIEGGAGDDTIYGAGDVDTIDGGAGNDILYGDFSLIGSGGAISGAPRFETLRGGAGNDFLSGDQGDDRLYGDGDNDTLLAGTGDDGLNGGDGNDILYFGAAFTDRDHADGAAGRDVLILQGNYTTTLSRDDIVAVESVSLQSGARTTWGDTANNFYSYNITASNDLISASQEMIVNGQSLRAGENFIFNGSAEESGRFLVYGGFGSDQLTGGAGTDAFFFEGSRWGAFDSANGGGGRDALIISGSTGVNHIEFLATSLASIESISLNARYAADPSQKPSYEIVMHDNNVAAGETMIVNGISLVDPTQTVNVDGSAETNGNFILFGGAGNDVLKGGAGADLFYANIGHDTLTGGGGADTFQYRSISDSNSSGGSDNILDFEGGVDRIDLSVIDADTTISGDQAFTVIGSNPFSGQAGELRMVDLGNRMWLMMADTDGDGFGDFFLDVTRTDTTPMIGSDFIL